LLALLTLVAALEASPAPAASPSAPPAAASSAPAASQPEDPSITKLAREQFDAFVAGKLDPSQYSITVPKRSIAQAQAGLSALGAIKSVSFVESAPIQGSMVYAYKFTCANGAVLEQLSVKGGKINGIYFAPAP
jgi:hypothetical protein